MENAHELNRTSEFTPPPTGPFDEYVHAKITMQGKRYGVPVFIDLTHGNPEEHATRADPA